MKTSPAHRIARRWLQARERPQIDADWIESVRRSWAKVIKPPRLASTLDAAYEVKAYISSVSRWLNLFSRDIIVSKGMWVESLNGALDSTVDSVRVRGEVLRGLKATQKLILDLQELVKPQIQVLSILSPLWDPRKELRKILTQQTKDMDDAFQSTLDHLSRHLSTTPEVDTQDIQFDLELSVGKLKLIYDSWERRSTEDMLALIPTFKPTFKWMKAPRLQEYVASLKHVQSLLHQKDLGFLWYGTIHIRIGASDNNAEYTPDGDTIYIYKHPNPKTVGTLIHELGHRYYFRFMTRQDRARFDSYFLGDPPITILGMLQDLKPKLMGLTPDEAQLLSSPWEHDKVHALQAMVKKYYHVLPAAIQSKVKQFMRGVPATSEYGQTLTYEDFAEVFKGYVLGQDLTRDQVERFKLFLGRTRRASLTGAGNRSMPSYGYEDFTRTSSRP